MGYWKENGNYYGILGLYGDNGKENGNYYLRRYSSYGSLWVQQRVGAHFWEETADNPETPVTAELSLKPQKVPPESLSAALEAQIDGIEETQQFRGMGIMEKKLETAIVI